jgi:Uma2 family endonuclease
MSVSLAYKPAMTPQEFLAWEEKQEGRYEYLHGAIRAMSGGSWNHNRIIQNISRHLGNRLNGKPCTVFSQGQQVQAAQKDAYFYPDVGVMCGEPTLTHNECTLLNPVLSNGSPFTLHRATRPGT